jgi:hypothetical protein
MKPNPKLNYFVENKICNTKDTPYILLEEGDKEKVQTLIKKTASNKADRDRLLERIDKEFYGFNQYPFYFLEQLIHSLIYGKRETGRHKVWKLQYQLFPNWNELQIVHSLQKYVDAYHNSLEDIEEGLKELSEIKKEEN